MPITATVAITGMNATDNPAPGVAVARALRASPEFQGKIIGLGYDALDPGFYMDGLLDGGAILPYPSAGKATLGQRMAELQPQLDIDVVLPTLDSELRSFIALEDDLARLGIRTWLPRLPALERAAKAQLGKLNEEPGVRTPPSETVASVDAIAGIARRMGYPLVIKGPYYGAAVVYKQADAIAAFHGLAAQWGFPITVQKFVAGEEYDVAGIGDGEGGLVGAVAMKKLALTDKGKGWSGVTVRDPRLLDMTQAVVSALRWRGPFEIECIVGRGHDDVHLIEINPRFPAWIYLSVGAGQNLPLLHLQLALGLSVPLPLRDYQAGKVFVRICLDQVGDLDTFGRLSVEGIQTAFPARSKTKARLTGVVS